MRLGDWIWGSRERSAGSIVDFLVGVVSGLGAAACWNWRLG